MVSIILNMTALTTRKLTDKQEKFLEHLVDTKGNLKLSAELAGYRGNHYQVLKSLKEEIIDLAPNVLAREAPSAAFKLVEIMHSDEAVPQANVKLQAAQTLLDRVGVIKKEKLGLMNIGRSKSINRVFFEMKSYLRAFKQFHIFDENKK